VQNLEELSWNQLVEELRELTENKPSAEKPTDDPRDILHNLFVHQVELEMQNRELRDAQQRLEASRSRYADLYDFAPVGCLTIDGDERIQEINLTGAGLLGRDRAEIIGKPFLFLMPLREKSAVFHEHFQRCMADEVRVDAELEFVPKGRAPMLLHMVSAPMRDADGNVVACRTALTDVTDRRRAERAEAEARIKEEFLGTVSHELRTPLTAIVGWVSVLQMRDKRDPEVDREALRRGLHIIARNAAVQSRLIDDILDVSRILTGKLRVELQPIDLQPLVLESVDSFRPAANAKAIDLSASVAPRAFVFADIGRLTQVVTNLLHNAIKFTPTGGRVELRVTADAEFVRIVVRDTGRGLESHDFARVFERFKQVDNSTTRTAGGLGLGLAIVEHIVRAHGGDVAATSPGIGLGATFTVTLRRASSAKECAPESVWPRRGDETSLAGRNILCVDDDIDGLEVMTIFLRERGAVVRTARSAADALAALALSTPDVVVSDIALPLEDGFSLIRQIRALPGDAARVPVIALTGYAGLANARRAREAGFQHVLSKPYTPEMFVRIVTGVAGQGQLTEAPRAGVSLAQPEDDGRAGASIAESLNETRE
jgi:PAS domain S-box-containing protein